MQGRNFFFLNNRMENTPKVSIHIISFNQKDYIAEAIESAVKQDYSNLEVVISDDASTDGTAEIISTYQQRYPHRIVSLLNKNNVGVTKNANRALCKCTGKYIAFQGGDDVLMPGKITAQVEWFEKDEERVLCGHQVEVFYQDGSRRPHSRTRWLFSGTRWLFSGTGPEKVIRYGTFGATSIMVRADKIPDYGFDELMAVVSDHFLWIEILAGGGKYGCIKGTYAKYRRHNSNVTKNQLGNLCEVERSLRLISERYPIYRKSCEDSLTRNVTYMSGVLLLRKGQKTEARKKFKKVISINPFYIKAWIRIAQSI